MDKVELILNDISSTNICRLSNYQLVGVDYSYSSVYRSLADNISRLERTGGGNTSFCRVVASGDTSSDTYLLGDMSHSLILASDHSVEEAANRVFQLDDIYVLSH